jgi:hypothetical protein
MTIENWTMTEAIWLVLLGVAMGFIIGFFIADAMHNRKKRAR